MAKQKFNLKGKKVAKNKLKSSDSVFNILSPVIVKTNFTFAIYKSKTFAVILAKTFGVSGLMLVKINDVGAFSLPAAYFLIGDSRSLG